MTAGFNKNAKNIFAFYVQNVYNYRNAPPNFESYWAQVKMCTISKYVLAWKESIWKKSIFSQRFFKNFYFGLSKLGWTDRL